MSYRRVDRGWVRDEPGHLSGGGRAYVHVVDEHDVTPPHEIYLTGYVSGCGWCWLNAPHSEAAHEASSSSLDDPHYEPMDPTETER
jgi:hypothetical protein